MENFLLGIIVFYMSAITDRLWGTRQFTEGAEVNIIAAKRHCVKTSDIHLDVYVLTDSEA